jgi:hypothetical protein
MREVQGVRMRVVWGCTVRVRLTCTVSFRYVSTLDSPAFVFSCHSLIFGSAFSSLNLIAFSFA